MNLNGSRLFVNAVAFGLGLAPQCPKPPHRHPQCVTLTKTAVPPDGTHVKPGDTILYTLTYTISDAAGCSPNEARLVDQIPMDTMYVPGSATDGGLLNVGTVIWNLGNLAPGTGSQSFKVMVMDTQCHDQRRVNNVARLHSSLGVQTSNLVSHPVDCPPVTFPNTTSHPMPKTTSRSILTRWSPARRRR